MDPKTVKGIINAPNPAIVPKAVYKTFWPFLGISISEIEPIEQS